MAKLKNRYFFHVDMLTLNELTQILQISIAPVTMISGVGLLLLSMTNRLGRVTDRIRDFSSRKDAKRLKTQVLMLYKRARIMRLSIVFGAITLFFTSIMMILNFIFFVMQLNMTDLTVILFSGAFLTLILSLGLFIYDLTLSLKAIKLDLQEKGFI
jgi:hypothetical protein